MCDYSLKANVQTRDAKVGDRLELVSFGLKGFALIGGKRGVATCLKPGTEIVFDRRPLFPGVRSFVECDNGERIEVTEIAGSCVARLRLAPTPLGGFQQRRRLDVVEFADGKMIALECLSFGERVTVLQLPVKCKRAKVKPTVFEQLRELVEAER